MRNRAPCLLIATAALLSSCGRYRDALAFREYEARYLQAQSDYCSTNTSVAERGLLSFRKWIIDRDREGKPRFNYDLNLLQVNGRLFLLYESLGETNRAELFYRDGARAYSEYLKNQHLPEQTMSKDELRERLALQEKGLDVGWMRRTKERATLQR